MTARRSRMPGHPFVLLVAGALLLASFPLSEQALHPVTAAGPFETLAPARFEARVGRGQLELATTTASPDHEIRLLEIVAAAFDAPRADLEFRPGVALPGYWPTTTERMLDVVSALESGSAVFAADAVEVRGVAADRQAYDSALAELRDASPGHVKIREDVVFVPKEESVDALCRQAFEAFASVRIAFDQSSAVLRTAAHAELDKVVEFAFDCSATTIVITGHTDASGDEAWNRKLSLMRSAAVAVYLANAGIPPQRLVVYGAGSTQPVADNATAYGRNQNRRIEFTLR